MLEFLEPFFDERERQVFASRQLPKGADIDDLLARLEGHFPGGQIALAQKGEAAIRHIVESLAARSSKRPTIALPSVLCGSVSRAVTPAAEVRLMDADESWNAIVDDSALGADILLIAGLGGKRTKVPHRRNPAQIIIDDACQCFDGTSGRRQEVDFGVFSFGAGKQMHAGGGAVIWSSRHDLAEISERAGASIDPWQLWLMVSQLDKVQEINTRRRANGLRLIERLRDVEWLRLPDPTDHVFLKFTVFLDRGGKPILAAERPKDHFAFTEHMRRRGVEVEDTYVPLHVRFPKDFTDPRYRTFRANRLWPEAITLPCRPQLTHADIDRIAEAVKSFRPTARTPSVDTGAHVWDKRYTPEMLDRPKPTEFFGKLFDVKLELVRRHARPGRIVDLGCGSGAHLLPLAEEGRHVFGVDFAPSLVDSVSAKVAGRPDVAKRIGLCCADITSVPLPDASFSTAFSFSTLSYLEDLPGALAEMHRLLEPGGTAVVEIGNARSFNDAEAKRVSTSVRSFHYRPGTMHRYIREAGFEVVETHVFQAFNLYGGEGPQSQRLNALLSRLLGTMVEGRLLDEVLSSSAALRGIAFRHLFVLRRVPAPAGLRPGRQTPERSRSIETDRIFNLRKIAAESLAEGKFDDGVVNIVKAWCLDPEDIESPLMLADLLDGPEERAFVAHCRKLAERMARRSGSNVTTEHRLDAPPSSKFNPPRVELVASTDERWTRARELLSKSRSVVDLGCGGRPIPEATAAVDAHLDALERSSGGIDGEALAKRGVRFVHQSYDRRLPFVDREFDCAWSHHSLEHVDDPGAACEEMMRIAKAGVIVTPGLVMDVLFGRTYHRWLVMQRASTLVFFEKTDDDDRPFGPRPNVFDAILDDGEWYRRPLGPGADAIASFLRPAYQKHAPFAEVVLVWQDRFDWVMVHADGRIVSSERPVVMAV